MLLSGKSNSDSYPFKPCVCISVWTQTSHPLTLFIRSWNGKTTCKTYVTGWNYFITSFPKGLEPTILTAVGVISHCNDAHRLLRNVSTQHFHVSSCVLVSSEDGSPHPVGPKDVIAIHRQAKRMDRLILQQDLRQKFCSLSFQQHPSVRPRLDDIISTEWK